MSNTNIENAICDAVDILVSKAVEQAGYDRTIQAMVLDCVDASIGKYKIKYQDVVTYAYSTNVDVSYSKNTMVYVLIPGNDNGKDKTILGAVKKLGLDYITVVDDADRYDLDGTNIIRQEGEIGLSSYDGYQTKHTVTIYDKDSLDDQLNIDIRGAELYLKNNDNILCGAHVRTNLPVAQRRQGNYGIIFTLEFTNNVIKTYILDIDAIQGNPYQQSGKTRQYRIFPIDSENFVSINKIELFVAQFPDNPENKKEPYDIFFSQIELCGVYEYPESDLNSCHLSLLTPQDRYFDNINTKDKTVQAQVRVKGKVVDNTDIQFYWFVESALIQVNSPYYNSRGGVGWKCINDKTGGAFDSSKDKITIKKTEVLAKELRYKCIAVYNDIAMEAIVDIVNYDAEYSIELYTSTGAVNFLPSDESPSIECQVFDKNGVLYNKTDFAYYWGYEEGGYQYSANDEEVDLNIYKQVNLVTINGFRTYRCSVYSAVTLDLIGTARINISNTLVDEENMFFVRINDGQKAFVYSESGIAPTKDVQSPLTLTPLSYVILNGAGNELEEEEAKKWQPTWKIPSSRTMLTAPNYSDGIVSEEYTSYIGKPTFSYDILDKFDIKKDKNNIILELNNDELGKKIFAETSFIFTKQGAAGTNGTEYLVVVKPNGKFDGVNEVPKFAELSNRGFNFNYENSLGYLKAELYKNGELIYTSIPKVGEKTTSGVSTEGLPISATWSVAKEKDDLSNLIIDDGSWTVTKPSSADYSNEQKNNKHNIVKVMFKYGDSNVTEYYGFGSVITKYCYSGYDIQYVPYSGFTDVLYASDGENPKYASDPFELKVYYNNKDVTDKRSYNWMILGKNQNIKFITKYDNGSYVEDPEKQPGGILNGPSHLFKVADKFNGLDTDDAILVSIPQVGWIRIPVHFSLDRFGNRGINGWDGNSITLDEENGIILAPQVGSGYKDANNKFNGVLMGTVKEYNSPATENGLFGFSEGTRSFFVSSDNGKVVLGKTGQGQIIIDPGKDEYGRRKGASIRSGNYDNIPDGDVNNSYIEYQYEDPDTGVLNNHRFSSSDGMLQVDAGTGVHNQGMIINLEIPYIHFGTGNFAVTPEGYMVAKGGGSIAGWKIGNNSLYKETSEEGNTVGINSKWTETNKKAFWAGLDSYEIKSDSAGNPQKIYHPYFCVDWNGQLTAYNAVLMDIYTEKLKIGDENTYWEIYNNRLYHTGGNLSVEIRKDLLYVEDIISVQDDYFSVGKEVLKYQVLNNNIATFNIKGASDELQFTSSQTRDGGWSIGDNFGFFMRNTHFKSVTSLPSNPDPNTYYFIRE